MLLIGGLLLKKFKFEDPGRTFFILPEAAAHRCSMENSHENTNNEALYLVKLLDYR